MFKTLGRFEVIITLKLESYILFTKNTHFFKEFSLIINYSRVVKHSVRMLGEVVLQASMHSKSLVRAQSFFSPFGAKHTISYIIVQKNSVR